MKKTIIYCLLISILLLCGCSEEAAPTTATEATTQPITAPAETTQPTESFNTAEYTAPLTCISLPYTTEEIKEGDVPLASYRYPTPAVILSDAEVSSEITLDLLNRIDQGTATANSVFEAAKQDYSNQANWFPYYYHLQYEPIRLDRNILSLYVTEYVFDGSPRSNTAYWSINYNLASGTQLSLPEILREDYTAELLVELICEGLSHYSEDEIYPEYRDVISQMFFTNTTTNQWYFTENGICFYFTPYEIGPYASGVITSQVPYEKLLGTLKEDYFPTEQLDCIGEPQIKALTDIGSASKDFSQLGELNLVSGENTYLFAINGSALNIRIKETFESVTQPNTETNVTVFAAEGMGPTDGLLVTSSATDLDKLTAQWRSGNAVCEGNIDLDANEAPHIATNP